MLDSVEDALPALLLPAGGLPALRSVAADVPFVPLLALECHLGPLPHRVDVQTGEPSTNGALAEYLSAATLGRLKRDDITAGGRFERAIESIWFEFDVTPGARTGEPALFAGFRPSAHVGADTLIALGSAMLGEIDDRTAALVRRCAGAVGDQTEITHLGAMCGRPDRPLRINVGAATAQAVRHYAASIELPPERAAALDAVLSAVDASTHHYLLALDLAQEVQPRFGVECYMRAPEDVADWRILLDRFVALGACTAEEADAVLSWPGHAPPPAGTAWPGALRHIERFLGGAGSAAVVRTLNHLKLVCAPGAPLAAKAYFLARHVWLDDRP
ncbi:MAG: hypothetical protein QOJ39_1547 [Candidatus Eremiobacteraeota bacterium]|nr:hypothetical protein [Candidatus Eremiobacteraeota bacterium]